MPVASNYNKLVAVLTCIFCKVKKYYINVVVLVLFITKVLSKGKIKLYY